MYDSQGGQMVYFKPKIPIGFGLEVVRMENVGIFYGH
jgi:hypothetical protein